MFKMNLNENLNEFNVQNEFKWELKTNYIKIIHWN